MKWLLTVLAMVLVAPMALAQDYLIKPGDTLQIEVLEDPALNRSALVSPAGQVSFPLAGSLRVAGRTTDQVQSALTDALAPNFASPPNVFVALASVAPPPPQAALTAPEEPTIDVYVMGEVNEPGRREVAPGTTVLQFFAEMGGFTRFAATKRVQLRRADARGVQRAYRINYKALENGAVLRNPIVLTDGDVIIVPQRRLFE